MLFAFVLFAFVELCRVGKSLKKLIAVGVFSHSNLWRFDIVTLSHYS